MLERQSIHLEKLLNQISGQWTIYILWVLDTDESLRFGELKRKINGISSKVLTERLRMLEAIGIVHRSYKPTVPPQVSYALTKRGKELSKPLYQLCELASCWYSKEALSPPAH